MTRNIKQISEEFHDAVNEANALLTTTDRTPEQTQRLAELQTGIVPKLQQEYNTVRNSMFSLVRNRAGWNPETVVVIGEEWITSDNNGNITRVR